MELKEQKYVVTLAEIGNLTKAAKKLNISQPALSLYIKNLENNFGELLFSRENRRITPTYLGELYIARAKEILEIGKRFNSEFAALKSGVRGKVTFGLTYWQSPIILPAILPKFKEQYPDIEVEVQEVTDEDNLSILLDEHKINFAIVEKSIPGYEETIISRDMVALLVSNKNEFAKYHSEHPNVEITVDELNSMLFLLHAPVEDATYYSNYLKNNYNISPSSVMPLKSMESVLLLVQQNFGVTLIPEKDLEHLDLKDIQKFNITSGVHAKTISTLSRKDEKLSDYSTALIKLLQQHFRTAP